MSMKLKFKHPKAILSICSIVSTGGWIALIETWGNWIVDIPVIVAIVVSDLVETYIWWESE